MDPAHPPHCLHGLRTAERFCFSFFIYLFRDSVTVRYINRQYGYDYGKDMTIWPTLHIYINTQVVHYCYYYYYYFIIIIIIIIIRLITN